MALLDDLRQEKAEYEKLSGVVNNISGKMNTTISSLEPANSGIKTAYTLNNYEADNGKISSNVSKLKTLATTLNGEVHPAIINKINELDARIKAEEERIRREQEEAARRAAEEAARRAQEESWKN